MQICKDTLSVSGGREQTYIQHIPEGSTKKQLIVAVSCKMAQGKGMTHKDAVEQVRKYIMKAAAPMKTDAVNYRNKLLGM